MSHEDRPTPNADTEEHENRSTLDSAANPGQPTKPDPAKNPTGVTHNPSQGGPSTRRNPEAGKRD